MNNFPPYTRTIKSFECLIEEKNGTTSIRVGRELVFNGKQLPKLMTRGLHRGKYM